MLPHGLFPILLKVVVEKTLPKLDAQRVHQTRGPIEVLYDAVKPIETRLEDCARNRGVPAVYISIGEDDLGRWISVDELSSEAYRWEIADGLLK